MQKTQHSQQTASRTAQNQDMETTWREMVTKTRRHTSIYKHLLGKDGSSALEWWVTNAIWGFKPGLWALYLILIVIKTRTMRLRVENRRVKTVSHQYLYLSLVLLSDGIYSKFGYLTGCTDCLESMLGCVWLPAVSACLPPKTCHKVV